MRFLQQHKLNLGFLVVVVLVIVLGRYAGSLPDRQTVHGQWVSHTHEVLNQLETLCAHLSEAENGEHGYLLTGLEEFQQSFLQSCLAIDGDIARVRYLTLDNPRQQGQVPLLRKRIIAKRAEMKQKMDLRRYLSRDAILTIILASRGGKRMETIRQQVDAMKLEEERLLQLRKIQWQTAAIRMRYVFWGGGALLCLLLGAVYAIMQREFAHRRRLVEMEQRATQVQLMEAERLAQVVTTQRDVACARQDLEKAMQTIAERARMITKAEGGVVEMLEGTELVYRAASGSATPYVGLRLQIAASLSGRCTQENTVLRCNDAETDDRVDYATVRKLGVRSMVVVPLRHERRAIGVLKVLSSRVDAFSERDAATLELMAIVLSAALSDAIATEELRDANARLEALATTDGLTGLKNHRTFRERLTEEHQRALRHKIPLSVMLLDVDHFKSFNDTYGHPAGDEILKRAAALLQAMVRTSDVVARYGGEEFVVLLPETDARSAVQIAERIRKAIEQEAWEQRAVTVSVGVATLDAAIESAACLVEAADRALYQSKRSGRNRAMHSNRVPVLGDGETACLQRAA